MNVAFKSQENIQTIMRRCGYFSLPAVAQRAKEGCELSFIRPLTSAGSGYPRFHAYVKIDEVSREKIINLHLDQKKPIYRGASAHAGEYEGELVEKEIERIKKILGL